MAWKRRIEASGPVYVSTDRKAKVYVQGGRFVLRVPSNATGERLDVFDELADAQAAYDTNDMSKGLRHQAAAAR